MFKRNVFLLATLWLIGTQTLPFFNALFPFSEALKFAMFVGVVLVLYPSLFIQRSVIAVFGYTLVLLSYFLLGNKFVEDINGVVVTPLLMLAGVLMAEFAFKYDRDYGYTKYVFYTAISCNVLMALLSIPQLIINPYIITMESHRNEYAESFIFVMKYSTIHGIPYLFAPLVFLSRKIFKKKKLMGVLWALITFLLFVVVYMSGAATPTLLSIAMIAIGAFLNIKEFSKKYLSRIFIIGMLGIILAQPAVLVPVLKAVQSTMNPDNRVSRKLGQVIDGIVYGETEGDWEERQELYESSTVLFLESPLIGTSTPEKIGHHAWILDNLAAFGIILFLPIVFLFVFVYKRAYSHLIHTRMIYLCVFACLIVSLYLKNDFGAGTWLFGFAFVPLICRYTDYMIENIKK